MPVPESPLVDSLNSHMYDREYVVDRVVDQRVVNAIPNAWDVQVRWFDGSNKWEPMKNVPRRFVVQYYEQYRPPLELPINIDAVMHE